MLIVVEKSPVVVGDIMLSEFSAKIIIVASLVVFPEIVTILFCTTSSSIGFPMVKNKDGFGVGVGGILEIVFSTEGVMVLVFS